MKKLNATYWEENYKNNQTGWDVGGPTQPFVKYFQSLKNKDIRIFIPGCGHAYEAELLFNLGFFNITLLDFSPTARKHFLNRVPNFPKTQYLLGDVFTHQGKYDLILEQTFFCALNPDLRVNYAHKMYSLLAPHGKLVGVLFDHPLSENGPPFGGSITEYQELFKPLFTIKKMERCINSIKPRQNREVFINLERSAID